MGFGRCNQDFEIKTPSLDKNWPQLKGVCLNIFFLGTKKKKKKLNVEKNVGVEIKGYLGLK
jgi:hypothetical protein